jgi:hypothetical protein
VAAVAETFISATLGEELSGVLRAYGVRRYLTAGSCRNRRLSVVGSDRVTGWLLKES